MSHGFGLGVRVSHVFWKKSMTPDHMSHACHFFYRSVKQKIEMDVECDATVMSVWRVSEEHRKIVTILKNAPILDFHCIAGKLKWIGDTHHMHHLMIIRHPHTHTAASVAQHNARHAAAMQREHVCQISDQRKMQI